jgi:predicted DNA-binding antitoxin AbrB/MazE fold protein
MTRQTIDAVFENGVFRVTSPFPVTIPDGQPVRLVVEIHDSTEDVLTLATHVYDGLSEDEITSVERIAMHRLPFFGERVQQ